MTEYQLDHERIGGLRATATAIALMIFAMGFVSGVVAITLWRAQ